MTDLNVVGYPSEEARSEQVLADWAAELADRLQAEGDLALEAYAREYPERAERLLPLLPAIALMARLKNAPVPVEGREAPPDRAGGGEPIVLGDFRILRVVGRGGMGVVYEAMEITLNRRV